jgi:hypothetical protein
VWPQCWDLQGPRGLEQRDLRNLNLGDLKKLPNGGVSPTPQKKKMWNTAVKTSVKAQRNSGVRVDKRLATSSSPAVNSCYLSPILVHLMNIYTRFVICRHTKNNGDCMVLCNTRSTQPLTEMSTRNLPVGKGRPERKADKLHRYL